MALRADDVDLDRDAALVERFQLGDEDAFADLYQRYFGRLRRYCQRRLGDPDDAEEAAQEALAKAYRALPNFGGDRRFYPWLRVIAANVCTDRCKRKPVAPLADPDGGDVVVDSVFDRLDQAFVRTALRDLNPRHRAALSLWADGHPSREIADELGCTPGAADVTLHRARQSFRARFLAITGDGKLAGVGALPALARFASRWRARIVTRVGDHAELASPLATKLAAGAIAFTVVGGAVATSTSPQQVSRTAPPPPVVSVQTSRASAQSPSAAPSAASTTAPHSPLPSDGARPPAPPQSSAPPPPTSPLPVMMSADEANHRSSDAPVKISAAGTFVNLDPQPVTNTVRRMSGSGGS